MMARFVDCRKVGTRYNDVTECTKYIPPARCYRTHRVAKFKVRKAISKLIASVRDVEGGV